MSTAPAEIASRLRHALEVTGKTQRGVERAIKMSKGYLSRLASEEGYGDVSVRWLAAVARELGVRFEWLAEGEGPMLEGEPRRQVVYDARYPTQSLAADMLRAEATNLSLDAEVVELAITELGQTEHDFAGDPGPLKWFELLRDIAAGIRRERRRLALDTLKAEAKEAADRARAAEMEEITRPKLQKRRP